MPRRVRRQNAFKIDPIMSDWDKDIAEDERCLWAACLKDGIQCAKGKGTACNKGIRDRIKVKDEAIRWFASENVGPGSFRWVCEVLGLDQETVREGVIEK